MSKLRALVVEDDARVLPSVEEVLFSLGHEHEWVTNQADAQERFLEAAFDYVLLDLQIPTRSGRGGASTECGLNLLRWMKQQRNGSTPPVILMTGQLSACVDLTRELTAAGASEFIAKPFPPQGRTLRSVICGVLDRPAAANSASSVSPALADSEWLTVGQCAELLRSDISNLDLKRATARVSFAAGRSRFRTNGQKGPARRVERVSFDAWRLHQRDRDLDAADAGAAKQEPADSRAR